MRTESKSRWKWLLAVIAACVATMAGMWVYAVSLDDWGEVGSVIFTMGPLLLIAVALVALFLLISDVMVIRRSKDAA
ncbi:MAG: hypothetical protein WD904_08900 [Dehalococcoidia bacterium]